MIIIGVTLTVASTLIILFTINRGVATEIVLASFWLISYFAVVISSILYGIIKSR